MKKPLIIIAGIACIFAITFFTPQIQAEAAEIPIHIEGVEVKPDVAPILRENRVFVPLRFISENLGALVHWDAENQQIWLDYGGSTRIINLGVPMPEYGIDAPAFVMNGRTMVPLRAIAEMMRKTVDYTDGKVLIYSNPDSPIFRRFTEDDIIYSRYSFLVFEKDSQYYICESSQVSTVFLPGHYSAMLLNSDTFGVLNYEKDDDGSIYVHYFSSFSARYSHFFMISAEGQVRELADNISAFVRTRDDIYMVWLPEHELYTQIKIDGTNLSRLRYKDEAAEPEAFGQNGFIYGIMFQFRDYDGDGIYVPIGSHGTAGLNYNEGEGMIYAIAVDTNADEPFKTAGYYRIDPRNNTQEKIRDLTEDEYFIVE